MTDPCSKSAKIAKIEDAIHESDKRDILQSEQILNMQKQIDSIDNKIDKNHEETKALIKELSEEFASKRVETAIKWFIGIVMTIVVSAMVYQVVSS